MNQQGFERYTMASKEHSWFETIQMDHGITRIREKWMDPGVACNIWHISGKEKSLLFDSGTGLVSLKKSLPHLFEHPVVCVSSHTHFDHVGGSFEFDDRRLHFSEKHIITRPTRQNTTVDGYMGHTLFAALPFDGFNPDDYQVKPAPPTCLLNDHDIIELGDRQIEVLHLPGHSPGTIGLYEQSIRTLFSSDAVYDGKLYDDVYHSSIPDYISTMNRLLTLAVDRVHPGHFDSFNQDRMRVLITAYLNKRQTRNPT